MSDQDQELDPDLPATEDPDFRTLRARLGGLRRAATTTPNEKRKHSQRMHRARWKKDQAARISNKKISREIAREKELLRALGVSDEVIGPDPDDVVLDGDEASDVEPGG